ncbi:DUF427 domain-containing protein [soil metagenome]
MTKAIYNGTVIAESPTTEIVEGNHYFPPSSLKQEHFIPTDHATVCPWKGTASYYSVEVEGERSENAAWTYRSPKEKATHIADHVAFYPVVQVVD